MALIRIKAVEKQASKKEISTQAITDSYFRR
jgi:hypothetical protein